MDDKGKLSQYGNLSKIYFVIWTTTTWTLPGNMAICLNPELDYALVKAQRRDLYRGQRAGRERHEGSAASRTMRSLATMMGCEFELYDRLAPLHGPGFSGHSAATTSRWTPATGCVHTAPGLRRWTTSMSASSYDAEIPTDISMAVSVNAQGVLNEFAGKYEGLHVFARPTTPFLQ